jgi:hypothetical protein
VAGDVGLLTIVHKPQTFLASLELLLDVWAPLLLELSRGLVPVVHRVYLCKLPRDVLTLPHLTLLG